VEHDNKRRSLLKGVTWRAGGSLSTMILVFIFTGSIEFTLGIGIAEIICKFIFYYLHERIWNAIKWGKE